MKNKNHPKAICRSNHIHKPFLISRSQPVMIMFHVKYSPAVSLPTRSTKLNPQIGNETTTSIAFVSPRYERLVCHGSLEPGGPPLPYHAYSEEGEEEEKDSSPFPSLSQLSYLGTWQGWVVGVLMSLILPFWGSRLGPLLKIKSEVETAVEVADIAAQVTEFVAEKAEEAAENAAEKMPEGEKYRSVVISIEMVAKATAKDAQLAEHFLEKVKELEEEVDSFMGEEGDPIDSALEKVEGITEVVEKVAERVEKAAEDMADRLPDGNLKAAATFTENAAKAAATDARVAEETIEKVEEEKEEVETIIGEGKLKRIIRAIKRR